MIWRCEDSRHQFRSGETHLYVEGWWKLSLSDLKFRNTEGTKLWDTLLDMMIPIALHLKASFKCCKEALMREMQGFTPSLETHFSWNLLMSLQTIEAREKEIDVDKKISVWGEWLRTVKGEKQIYSYSDLFPVNLWWLCRWGWPEIDPKDGPQLSHSPDKVGSK